MNNIPQEGKYCCDCPCLEIGIGFTKCKLFNEIPQSVINPKYKSIRLEKCLREIPNITNIKEKEYRFPEIDIEVGTRYDLIDLIMGQKPIIKGFGISSVEINENLRFLHCTNKGFSFGKFDMTLKLADKEENIYECLLLKKDNENYTIHCIEVHKNQ